MAAVDSEKGTPSSPPHYIFCPASTYDYRIEALHGGFGLVANRDIPEGDNVFGESLEFCFRDVKDGDFLLLVRNYADDAKDLPLCLPVNRKVLLETHGVPQLVKDEDDPLQEIWHLESPGMLMNHSCDPTTAPVNFDWLEGEGIATRDIAKGGQLTCDYGTFDYDEDGMNFDCHCGATNCRGKRIGFAHLTEAEKEERLSKVAFSDVVLARHRHSLGKGPHVVTKDQPPLPRPLSLVPRLVLPGPTCAMAHICIRPCQPTIRDDAIAFGLFANKDFAVGERVFYFWSQPWPRFPDRNPSTLIDMVSGLPLNDTDPAEGTVMAARLDPRKCASQEVKTGDFHFSGYNLLIHHSCNPNIVYKYSEEEDEDNWRGAYACREIRKGDSLLVDFNCCMWDRSSKNNDDDMTCQCGADNCRESVPGFCHLTSSTQKELESMTWNREPGDDSTGKALAPYIRKQLRK